MDNILVYVERETKRHYIPLTKEDTLNGSYAVVADMEGWIPYDRSTAPISPVPPNILVDIKGEHGEKEANSLWSDEVHWGEHIHYYRVCGLIDQERAMKKGLEYPFIESMVMSFPDDKKESVKRLVELLIENGIDFEYSRVVEIGGDEMEVSIKNQEIVSVIEVFEEFGDDVI